MADYVLLPHPGHGRLYLSGAFSAAAAELSALVPELTVAETALCGAPAYALSLPRPLTEVQLRALAASSLFYALFLREGALLLPVEPPEWRAMPDELNTILKYPGKTNERFTRLLVHLAAAAAARLRPVPTLLDPMCGQGTTLFEAAIRGWNAIGVETLEQPLHKGQVYFERYLKTGRYKHKLREEPLVREGKRLGRAVQADYALSREAWQAEETRFIRFVRGDGAQCGLLLPRGCADVLACDLPYGVQHGASGREGLRRDAAALTAQCAPGWFSALRPGGGLALAYNRHTTRRDALERALRMAGFAVLPPIPGLEHRVDQAILRDVLQAQKPL